MRAEKINGLSLSDPFFNQISTLMNGHNRSDRLHLSRVSSSPLQIRSFDFNDSIANKKK